MSSPFSQQVQIGHFKPHLHTSVGESRRVTVAGSVFQASSPCFSGGIQAVTVAGHVSVHLAFGVSGPAYVNLELWHVDITVP